MEERMMGVGGGERLTYYDLGSTPFFAAQADPRFSYCLHVPEDYVEDGEKQYSLIVIVHGTERSAEMYRNEFAVFGEENDSIVLAPLFPANATRPDDLENYKFIDFDGVRFDEILLSMVREVAAKYRLRSNKFILHGFSGGGHFAHRFFYLHPLRLQAVSIGAPGVVTLLDEAKLWWVGVADLKERFGIEPNLEAMRSVEVQMVIGSEDSATWEITVPQDSIFWAEGVNDSGVTRLDRMEMLKASFERHGIAVRHDVVPGVAHDGSKVLPPVMDFIRDVLGREFSK